MTKEYYGSVAVKPGLKAFVCPCVFCWADHFRKCKPFVLCRWVDVDYYWSPNSPPGHVTIYGPQHAGLLRKNTWMRVYPYRGKMPIQPKDGVDPKPPTV